MTVPTDMLIGNVMVLAAPTAVHVPDPAGAVYNWSDNVWGAEAVAVVVAINSVVNRDRYSTEDTSRKTGNTTEPAVPRAEVAVPKPIACPNNASGADVS